MPSFEYDVDVRVRDAQEKELLLNLRGYIAANSSAQAMTKVAELLEGAIKEQLSGR